MSRVGDLGRRVCERRKVLGLTIEEVAARANMDPSFLRKLEEGPASQLSVAAQWRLAAALETTVDQIRGGGTQEPPGQTNPVEVRNIDVLDRETCRSLIAPGGVGRIVFTEVRGPVALPVNYRMLGDDILFRTAATSALLRALKHEQVSFEVDSLDDALAEGWSVLVSGSGDLIVDPVQLQRALKSGVTPWANGKRDDFICIKPREITGRRIRR